MTRFVMILIVFFAMSRNANATLSSNIMFSCAVDYFQYCSQYPVNSDKIKDCFREVGSKLQPMCIKALEEENMITEEDKAKTKEEPQVITPEVPAPAPIPEEKEAQPFSGAPVYKESQFKKVKENVVRNISERVAKFKTMFSKKKTYVKAEKTSRKRKLQKGGKWDGYTLYVEWKDSGPREHGSELTLYGYEDRN